MTIPTSSTDRVRRVFDGYAGLYAPSVIEEAARLLDDLLDTAVRHGYDRNSSGLSMLVSAVVDAAGAKYGRPDRDRTSGEISVLTRALTDALTEQGLTLTPARVRMGVAVEREPGGPSWGMDGRTGLAVALYADSGWDLMVNQPQTRVFTIHAPVTPDGAREVAAMVRGVLRGEIRDPFRRN